MTPTWAAARRPTVFLTFAGLVARTARREADRRSPRRTGGNEPAQLHPPLRRRDRPAASPRRRVEAARGRVEAAEDPIDRIALEAGFGDPERMCRGFLAPSARCCGGRRGSERAAPTLERREPRLDLLLIIRIIQFICSCGVRDSHDPDDGSGVPAQIRRVPASGATRAGRDHPAWAPGPCADVGRSL